jgi:tetratricopeptide (TPR) repeat protein
VTGAADGDTLAARAAGLILAGNPDAALDLLGPAVARQPGRAALLDLMAEAHARAGRLGSVLACRQAALAVEASADRHAFLAMALHDAGRLDEAHAQASLAQSLSGQPHQNAQLALGLVAVAQGRLPDAQAVFVALIESFPGNAPAHAQLGTVLWSLGDGDGAKSALRRALDLEPDLDAAAGALGLILLAEGRFAEGWALYRRRHVSGRSVPPLQPLPARLDGKVVLVEGEQGLGDELFFLRFVPEMKARGARIVYRPAPRLAPVLRGVGCVDALAGKDEAVRADIRVWAGDLPFLLGADEPRPALALVPDPERVEAMRRRLEGLAGKPVVGVTWRAGTQLAGRLSKALAPEGIAAALAGCDCHVVALQRNPLPGEVERFAAALGRPVLDMSAVNDDLEDMLALLSLLDRQVAVSNTNLHLAAGLGKPASLLLPRPPEFRWMAEGDTSPWFPTMRLYRQRGDGSWRSALEVLATDLGGSAGGRGRLDRAVAMKDAGDLAGAEQACRDVLAQAPDDLDALRLLAGIRMSARRPDAALAPLARLAELSPTAENLRFLGQALVAVQQPDAAADPLARSLALDPGQPGLAAMLAAVLMEAGRYDEALAQARDCGAVAVEGTVLHLQGLSAQAEPVLRRALAQDPGDDKAMNSLAQALYVLGRYDEARRMWQACLAANPDNHRAKSSLALMLLGQGEYGAGWDLYRFRYTATGRPGIPSRHLPPRLDGYSVAVIGEQGLGDELFFLRFVERLAGRGAKVTYVPGDKILTMVRRLGFLDKVQSRDEKVAADIGIWPGDLPWLLDETGPLPPVALTPLPDLVAEMRQVLAAFGPPPYTGVTWRAGIKGFNKLAKDIPPEVLARSLASVPGSVVVLQRAPEEGEAGRFAEALGRPVLDMSLVNDDLERMLALLSVLDRQVAVSNTNVHLAASLGRTVFALLPHPPEFRWLVAGDSSPWFPGCRLYRQGDDGGWAAALDRLSADLG